MLPAETVLVVHVGGATDQAKSDAVAIYREVYAEPPYLETERDFEEFASSLESRSEEPAFVLTLAYDGDVAVGFAMGHELRPCSRWWEGTERPLSEYFKKEYAGRTFAVIELAVRAGYRRNGIGRRLHAHLIAEVTQERVTLLVRPDAPPARNAYVRWGYSKVDCIQPFSGGPVYDLMLINSS